MDSNMASLMDLVSQNQPRFQTHQALLIIGLQNDFVTSEGRLPVDTQTRFLERIKTLIPIFRERSGNVIWVQTLFEADRIATGADTGEGDTLVVGGLVDGDEKDNDAAEEELAKEAASLPAQSRSSKHKQRAIDLLKRVSARRKTLPKEVAKAKAEEDEELFLLRSEKRTPACVPDTHGADFADVIANQVELSTDVVIRTTNYSAFQGTNLLITLRARLITELFIVGCITNVSVLATVIDAARHGVKIHVVEDCLGYRKENRHDLALKRMEDFFSAFLVNSEEILKEEPQLIVQKTAVPAKGGENSSDTNVEEMMAKMSLATSIIAKRTAARTAEESKAGGAVNPSDKEFSDILTKGATVPGAQEEAKKPELVKTKIRMRTGKSRKKKKKTKEGEEPKGDDGDADGKPGMSTDQGTKDTPPTTASPTVIPPPASTESQRNPKVAKAGSVADLRQKEGKQHILKNATSVPMLSTKADGEETEKNRLSDFSDRVRMSFTRAAKSESGSESKRASTSSANAASTNVKQDDKQPTLKLPQREQSPAVTQEIDPPSSAKATTMRQSRKLQSLATFLVLGPGDHIAEGDSRIMHNFFSADYVHLSAPSKPLKDIIFTQLYNEVPWQTMLHQQGEVPRLVCCQGAFGDDGSMPIYRHPSDQSLPLLRFSPKVQLIRKHAEKLVGHPLNHVLIQLYRSGNDFISEHSDKTLDIVKGSSIVNVSFGSQRTMRLRTKKAQSAEQQEEEEEEEEHLDSDTITQRRTQRVVLPHNSMFVLGLAANAKWLHGIQPDKRPLNERTESETAYNGIRISLTFRHIGTFLDARETVIWGQGASAKTQRDAADIISNDEAETVRLITAFSRENHDQNFDWEEHYGDGSDVLHLHAPLPSSSANVPLLFLSNNAIQNNQVMILLAEKKLAYTAIEAPSLDPAFEADRQVTLRDTDAMHTEIHSASSILLYLDHYHPLDTSASSHCVTANAYPIMLLTAGIVKAWSGRGRLESGDEVENLVRRLEEMVEGNGGPFVAGSRFSIADAFVWPVVHVLVGEWDGWKEGDGGFEKLGEWYRACWRKKASIKKVVGALAVPNEKDEEEKKV